MCDTLKNIELGEEGFALLECKMSDLMQFYSERVHYIQYGLNIIVGWNLLYFNNFISSRINTAIGNFQWWHLEAHLSGILVGPRKYVETCQLVAFHDLKKF